jgi:hypothetical protein
LALLKPEYYDLALLVERWDTLPNSIRRAILAVAESAV